MIAWIALALDREKQLLMSSPVSAKSLDHVGHTAFHFSQLDMRLPCIQKFFLQAFDLTFLFFALAFKNTDTINRSTVRNNNTKCNEKKVIF
eukprot:Nitzschia sp. Nitz4//NODE_474_length_16687_cov_99.124940//9998//10515//NITZ4_additional_000068-RA//1//CDS//3329531931//6473//frame0